MYLQLAFLPTEVEALKAAFPVVAPISTLAIIWGEVAIACWEAMALICLPLIFLSQNHRLPESFFRLLKVILGLLFTYILLAVAALVALVAMEFTTPGVMLGLIGTCLISLILFSALGLYLVTRR